MLVRKIVLVGSIDQFPPFSFHFRPILLSLADAWEQMVMDDILVELARRVYIEIKGAVIVRAWKKSKRRLEYKNRKVSDRGGIGAAETLHFGAWPTFDLSIYCFCEACLP